ncbi:hypothetical protein ACFLYO_07355 [Chloroflexota bacterium]
MPTLAIQYLESNPVIADLTPTEVREKLRAAFDLLPLDMVLVGWLLPDKLLNVVVDECQQAGADLYRWHLLLTGDGVLNPPPEWQVIGLNGRPVPGFKGMPEFTFMCPNRPAVQEAVLSHLQDRLADDRYTGLFLDRIRWPSPAENLDAALGCFCPDCQRVAAASGLNLIAVRQHIANLTATRSGLEQFMAALLNPAAIDQTAANSDLKVFTEFLDWRRDRITGFVGQATQVIRKGGKSVGLDCFTLALTGMVGQDLRALNAHGDWIKPMIYGHTYSPAGIVYELSGLADWLIDRHQMAETEAMALLVPPTSLYRTTAPVYALTDYQRRASSGKRYAGCMMASHKNWSELSW